MRRHTLAVSLRLLLSTPIVFPAASGPTIDDLISLKRVGSPTISPDGHWVAYTVRETNWDADRYDTQLYLANVDTGAIRQITHAARSSTAPAWSPDGKQLAFASDRTDKRQIYLLDPTGGEAEAITSGDESPGAFRWSPDGRTIAYTSTDPAPDALKAREKEFGQFDVIGEQHRMTHLHLLDVATHKTSQLTKGAFTVGGFDWSPDGTKIAFDHRINSDNANGGTADISIVTVGDGVVRALVTQAGPDTNPVWSPDGTQIAFETALANPAYFYSNTVIATIPASGGAIRPLSKAFDEDPSIVDWRAEGLYFSASARTNGYLYRLNPQTMQTTKVMPGDGWSANGFTIGASSRAVAFIASNPATFPEVFVGSLAGAAPKKITMEGLQVAAWPQPTREVVTWKSQDGATIEGVLHKPADFKAGQKYPLLVVIHGGPTGVSRPTPFASTSTYPIDLWLNQGALVLEPNYRGSAGYGEAFRALNVRNLGVGDAWDVLSGIDALIAQGLVDPAASARWAGARAATSRRSLDARQRAVQGDLGRRRHLGLDDVLRDDGHHAVHAAVSEGDAVGRSGDLQEDLADHVHQGRQDADAHPARRHRPARAAAGCVRALPRAARSARADEAHRLPRLRGRRAWAVETQVLTRSDDAQPRMVRRVFLRRRTLNAERETPNGERETRTEERETRVYFFSGINVTCTRLASLKYVFAAV